VSSGEAASWLQATSDRICVSGFNGIPVVTFVAIPLAIWLGQHTVATLWGEFVKHILRRRIWLDDLAKTQAKLRALEAVVHDLKAQAAMECQRSASLIVENDRLLNLIIVQTVAANAAVVAHSDTLGVPA